MAAGAGHLNSYAIGILVDLRRLEALRVKIISVGSTVKQFNASFRGKGVGASIKNIEALTVALTKLGVAAGGSAAKVVSGQTAITSSIKGTAGVTAQYSNAFSQYNKTLLGAAKGTKNAFTDMFRRVALWSAGVGLLFGVISKVRTVFQGMKDLEQSMTELKKVMDDATPWTRAQASILDTAKTFGVAATEVAKISQVWAQQGKTLDEVISLTSTAALGMQSANLTATQSVEFLTSATKAYNVEASQTERIIDGIMRVQSDFAITSAALAKGFNVAGAIAAKVQIDMGSLFGMMTAIGEVTRETGSTIGNSLKTQFARLNNPATIKYLQTMGIQMREIVKETGELRRLSPDQIFKQISDKSKSGQLSIDEVIDISRTIGGIRKFKDALILIERFGVAEAARTKFLLAYNDAQRASDLVQENLTTKAEKLETAFLALGLALSDQGLYTGIKTVVDGMRSFIEFGTTAARQPGGERGIKIAGITLLVKSIYGLTKVIGGAAGKGVLKGAATVAGGSSVFGGTRTQQTQLRLYNNLLNKNITQITKNIAADEKLRASFIQLAATTNSPLGTTVKKVAIDMAEAGLKVKGSGNVLQNAMAGASANVKAFGIGLRNRGTSTGLQTTKAGTLGAGGVGGKILGGLKGLGSIALWFIAIEAITRVISWLTNKTDDAVDVLQKNIDITSQASQGVLDLSSSYKKNQAAALQAKKGVDSYVASLLYSQRFDDSNELSKGLASAIRGGLVKTVQDLKKFLNDPKTFGKAFEGLEGLTGIDTFEQAQEVMLKLHKFLKYELAGGLEEGLTVIRKGTSEVLSELNEVVRKELTATLKSSKLPTGEDRFNLTDLGGKDTGGLFDLINKLTKVVGENLPEVLKEFGQTKIETSGTLGGRTLIKIQGDAIRVMAALIDSVDKNSEKLKYLTEKEIPALGGASGSALVIGKAMLESFGLSKETSGLRGGVEGSEQSNADAIIKVRKTIQDGAGAAMKLLGTQLKLPKGTLENIEALGRVLGRSIGEFASETYGATFAMVAAEDLIFKATTQFVADMKKINIKETIAPSLGLPDNTAVEKLGVVRKFFQSITSFRPGLEKSINDLDNLRLSFESAIPDTASKEFTSIAKRFSQTESIGDTDAVNALFKQMEELDLSKEGDSTFAERAKKRLIGIGGQLITKQSEFKKLIEVGSNFGKAMAELWDKVIADADKLGLSIESEAKVKKLAQLFNPESIAERTVDDLRAGFGTMSILIAEEGARASKEVFEKMIPGLAAKVSQSTNQLNSVFSQLSFTGNRFVDNQTKLRTELENTLNTFRAREKSIIDQQKLGVTDTFLETNPQLKQLKIEKDIAIATAKANIEIANQVILQNDVIEATNAMKSTLTSMLSDVAAFTDTTGRSLSSALSGIAGQRLEYQMRNLLDEAFKGAESDIGAAILGIEKPTLTPEQQAMIKSFDFNTIQLQVNTGTLQTVDASLKLLTLAMIGGQGVTETDGGEKRTISSVRDDIMRKKMAEDAGEESKETTAAVLSMTDQLAMFAGNLAGGLGGNALADALGKESNNVNAGVGAAGTIASLAGASPILTGISALVGGLFGALFGSDKDEDVKPIKEDIRKIADNTAELVAIDKRLINAPAGLTLPASAAGGGGIVYNLEVNVNGNSNSPDFGNNIARAIERQLSNASSNFNRVNDTIS